MSEWDVKICCMGAGYVGGPTMAVIAKQCPKVSSSVSHQQHKLPVCCSSSSSVVRTIDRSSERSLSSSATRKNVCR